MNDEDNAIIILDEVGFGSQSLRHMGIGPIGERVEALKMEETLALELRRQRYAVWFN